MSHARFVKEAQAREVIKAWVIEGYSLRHVVTEALLVFSQGNERIDDMEALIPYLEKIIDKLEYNNFDQAFKQENEELSSIFISAVKKSVKSGLGSV
jgi:hypothetical protein